MAGVLFTFYSTCLCYRTTIEQKFFRKSCFTCVRVGNYRKSTAAFDLIFKLTQNYSSIFHCIFKHTLLV